MRIFVHEFITGGGLVNEPLPRSLEREGGMMLGALLRDLAEIAGVEILVTRDARLPPLDTPVTLVTARPGEALAAYRHGLSLTDVVWPIAPETGGTLERLTQLALDAGKIVLGSRIDALRLATSKRLTYRALTQASIATVPTYLASEPWPEVAGAWVVKPDDGAGCVDARVFADRGAARAWLAAHPGNFVAQPWLQGEALSLCALCADGEAKLLCVNRQHVFLQNGKVSVDGLEVNAINDRGGEYQRLAQRIAATLPGLWGCVGIDLVRNETGLVVLEINPRLTTSYCALREALGINVAQLILDLRRAGQLGALTRDRDRTVEIDLGMDYA